MSQQHGIAGAQFRGMSAALAARMSGTAPTDEARPYMGMRVLDLFAARLGIQANDPNEVIARAATGTSDLPLLLADASQKVLLAGYRSQQPSYRAWCARRDFRDFKPHNFVRAGDFPDLLPLSEHGEIKSGTIREGRESVSLETKARLISFTRRAIVNDDLGGIGQMLVGAGRVAARAENNAAYAALLANSGAGASLADGVPMFHADRGNLAGAGAAPSVTTLGAARAAMRKQTSLDGVSLNVSARTLLVGPDLETAAEQLVASITPNQTSSVNPFSGKLSVVTDAAIAGSAWWTFAEPTFEEANFVYGYLDGADAPQLSQAAAFNLDGVSFRLIHDFAVGAIDHRFAYRNPGA